MVFELRDCLHHIRGQILSHNEGIVCIKATPSSHSHGVILWIKLHCFRLCVLQTQENISLSFKYSQVQKSCVLIICPFTGYTACKQGLIR